MDIGKRLKIARDAIGYTLEKVAQLTDIGTSSLSEFENGKREPKFSQLAKLSEVYKKRVEFFLSDDKIIEPLMLWRKEPDTIEEKKEIQAEFKQLCEQYHSLEIVTGQTEQRKLPEPDVNNPKEFELAQAEAFARKVQNQFCLGDIPSTSLKRVLEEKYFVKIFHLEFSGSAISSYSPVYGYAVLLNSGEATKQWRRNYDLAHELFHLCTMNIFKSERPKDDLPAENEDKFADAFASRLLLPTDQVKDRIEKSTDKNKEIRLEDLDEIAREFGVSLDALLWRMLYLYNKKPQDIEKYLEKAKELKSVRPPRQSDKPDKLPERYCSLAIKALKEGRMSLIMFARYMDLSYKQAEEYLVEDEDFTDEKIPTSPA